MPAILGAILAGAFCLAIILAREQRRRDRERQAWLKWYRDRGSSWSRAKSFQKATDSGAFARAIIPGLWLSLKEDQMATQKQQQQPTAMILEPVAGLQDGKLKRCIFCQQELSQDWIRISRTGAGYSVASHPACLARRKSDGAG